MPDANLRKLFRKHLPKLDWQAIETGSTSGGVPDANYAMTGGIEGWIEMKKADHWRCGIRAAQIGWIERRLRFNPRVFVAVRRNLDELWFFPGEAIRALKTTRLDKITPECPGHWTGGPAKWDWGQIEEWLHTG